MGDLEKTVFGQRTFSGWDLGRCPRHRHVITSVDSCPEVRKVEISPVTCGWPPSKPYSRNVKRVVAKRACERATSGRLCHCAATWCTSLPTARTKTTESTTSVWGNGRFVHVHLRLRAGRTSFLMQRAPRMRRPPGACPPWSPTRLLTCFFRVFPGLHQHFEKHD